MGSTTDRVSARARAVPVSPIRRMFDLTPRVPGAISLAVGEPGFATPPHIVVCSAAKAMGRTAQAAMSMVILRLAFTL